MRRLAVLAAAGLAACATVDGPSSGPSIIGWSEIEVVQRLGPPHHSYDVGDVRFLSWTFERRIVQPGFGPSRPRRSPMLGMPLPGSSYGAPPVVLEYQCTILAELDRTEQPASRRGEKPTVTYVVRAAREQGNGC